MSFPEPHIYEPTSPHTHTIIFLHGRGSNGPEFSAYLFNDLTTSGQNLRLQFPHVRWVFPTATTQLSTVFQEDRTEWFDIYSLSEPDNRADELQVRGLSASVKHIHKIIGAEVQQLGGDATKVVLAGFSQGFATALMTLVCGRRRLGGFVGVSGWMAFARQINELAITSPSSVPDFLKKKLKISHEGEEEEEEVTATPIWLGHGDDDAWINIDLGRSARDILTKIGFVAKWTEYTGAELEGHWLKVSEEFDDIAEFLRSITVR